jgi:ABC-2 type transport system ATP-binding protein
MQNVQEQYWSKFAQAYDANQAYAVGEDLLKTMTETVDELSDLGDVAEFGCGTGYFTQTIAPKATHVTATDLSDELLKVTKTRFKNHPGITTQKENCMQTSFPAQHFDTVFMANVIHVIEDPLRALQESHRILKDGGQLIIVTFTNSGMTWLDTIKLGFRFLKAWGRPPRHAQSFSLEKLGSLLQAAGFTVEKSRLLGNRTKAVYLIGKKQ